MIIEIKENDTFAQKQLDALLSQEGIRRDKNLDYTCGIFDDEYELLATGSCYKNTIRCTAVSGEHQGEGLLNQIMSHLMTVQAECGNSHVFVYTKPESAGFFADIGFYEIVRTDRVVFMENKRNGLADWIGELKTENQWNQGTVPVSLHCRGLTPLRENETENHYRGLTPLRENETENHYRGLTPLRKSGTEDRPRVSSGKISAIVMNANPFTKGHRYLVEKAAQESEIVHLFVVSEDASLIPHSVRSELVRKGTADLANVICHDSGDYIISSATFPGYFLKDEDDAVRAQAEMDIRVFSLIAKGLGITARYAGTESASRTTAIYNEVMQRHLPEAGVQCIIVPRLEVNGEPISASRVRQLLFEIKNRQQLCEYENHQVSCDDLVSQTGSVPEPLENHDELIKALSDLLPETTLEYFVAQKQ